MRVFVFIVLAELSLLIITCLRFIIGILLFSMCAVSLWSFGLVTVVASVDHAIFSVFTVVVSFTVFIFIELLSAVKSGDLIDLFQTILLRLAY